MSKKLAEQLDEEVILPSPELSACCDIANGFKHLKLHRRSYVTKEDHGHSEVVSHGINIGVPAAHVRVTALASAAVIHPDGTIAPDPPPNPEPPPPPPPPASNDGWVQDTFGIDIKGEDGIDIKGEEHDAQEVADRAVAAWEQWLASDSPLAARLRNHPTDDCP